MKIKSLHLKNFKRFTDLTIQDIPADSKLVLLIGSNGSGKSSVFDAFEYIASQNGKATKPNSNDIYTKNSKDQLEVIIETYEYGFEGTSKEWGWKRSNKLRSQSFYGRTSFRQIPRIRKTGLGNTFNIEGDSDRPGSFIDRDERFENDLEHIFGRLLKDFFSSSDDKSQIKRELIEPVNNAFSRIFSGENDAKLQLVRVVPPLEGKIADIVFKKGESEFHYNYLSAGEKEVFNILINFVARQAYYTDTIFFFDEIDLHLNTKLQKNFLKEIIEYWIPTNCQFWTASHSLGFIEYAKESAQAVIFDFDDYNFDERKTLTPAPKDNASIYEIAVDKEILPSLFKDYTIFFVENKDRNYYSSLSIPNILFVQASDKKSVYHKTKNGDFHGIIDRDFLTDDDITELEKQYSKLKILRFYSIENYLYHPDNLEEYYLSKNLPYDKEAYIQSLNHEKDLVKDEIKRKLAMIRMSYPFFEEPEHRGKANQKRFANAQENLTQVAELESYLNSKEFNSFYKIFPMKDYATQLKERQSIDKSSLSKTKWFKQQIESLLK